MDNLTRSTLVFVTEVASGKRPIEELQSDAVNVMACIYENELAKSPVHPEQFTQALDGVLELYCYLLKEREQRMVQRIPLIKAVRCITGWGIREAKDWVDSKIY